MEKLLKDYADKANTSLRKISESNAKSHLEFLLKFTTLKV